MKQQRQTFEQHMEQLARRHGVQAVFSDFLTLLVCAFSLGQREDEYMKTIRKYEKPEAYRFSEALAALVIKMTGNGTGMVDILGDYFEQYLSYGKNGQFFTPQHICDLMARLNNPVLPLQRILDPACGSGRMLMAMAKLNRHALFYGADNDRRCAMMTVINFTLNGMFGEVSWMNSITNEWYGGWAIEPTVQGCPRVRQITEAESYIHLKTLRNVSENETPVPKIEIPVSEIETVQIKPGAQLVFEF